MWRKHCKKNTGAKAFLSVVTFMCRRVKSTAHGSVYSRFQKNLCEVLFTLYCIALFFTLFHKTANACVGACMYSMKVTMNNFLCLSDQIILTLHGAKRTTWGHTFLCAGLPQNAYVGPNTRGYVAIYTIAGKKTYDYMKKIVLPFTSANLFYQF